MEVAELQKQNEALKAELEKLKKEIAENRIPSDLEGLKRNRDELLKEKKELQKRYEELLAKQEEEKKRKMEEEGKYKELLEKERAEKEKILKEKEEVLRKSNLLLAAQKHGFNTKYIKLLDDVEFDENGKIVNEEEYFNKKKEEDPILFTNTKKNVPATDAGKPKVFDKGHIFTREEVRNMDLETYKKFRDVIREQEREGLLK